MDDFVDFGYLRSQSYNSPPSAPSYSQRQDGRLSYGMENQDAPQPQRYPGKTGPTETYQRPESEYVPQQAYGAPQQPQQYNSPRNASAYPSQGAGIPAQQYNGPQMTLYSPPPPPPPPNYGPPAGYQGPPNSNVPLPQPLPGGAIMVNPFNQTGRVYGRKRK